MKKIMFNDRYGLTKAVLEGRKTMTRRIVNFDRVPTLIPGRIAECCLKYAPFKPGEVVAVAQKYSEIPISGVKRIYSPSLDIYENALAYEPGWNNKMFVRADLMPHQIRITNVRVERLQDISDEDCLREGIVEYTCNLYEYRGICYSFEGDKTKMGAHKTPREAFAALIDKVSGKGTWRSNPWVFVYEFELVK